MRTGLLLLFIIFFSSCEDDVVIKPNAMLRLEYPTPSYEEVTSNCPYIFKKNNRATLVNKQNCGVNIVYPNMKATVYLTYRPVHNRNLDSLLYDAQKLTYDHTIKAKEIPEKVFVNPENKVYGMFYMINGNAATQTQFYVTDSVQHFVTGSVYFETKPNFDSLYPAIEYLRNDVRQLMESLEWKN
ncbi:gliding motility lipoprotein GldD [Cochleicola gelatinilyticus]|uniref:Gliding motility lipoprotein GldD n=1 Tax=Cochleicola gelatinilyticus TaxID=1763537 RepID=A0A167IU39_9FLAO|nr:gliding motility lipoprotein GldD [Cochleicola gelatinilyticus]OAB80015.1 gliding motility lipoprotein GldD [Cochleicola gelatinilyticus]